MKLGPLILLKRTSGRRTFNLASWHSPHSLTWSWIASLALAETFWPKSGYFNQKSGPHRFFVVGLFPFAGLNARKDNNGWQWGVCFLWLRFEWMQQRPMWYRNLYQDEVNARYERRRAA